MLYSMEFVIDTEKYDYNDFMEMISSELLSVIKESDLVDYTVTELKDTEIYE